MCFVLFGTRPLRVQRADYTPSPAKWLRPKRSEIPATRNSAASFRSLQFASHAFADQGWGDGMADVISRTGYRGPGSYKPHPKEMPR